MIAWASVALLRTHIFLIEASKYQRKNTTQYVILCAQCGWLLQFDDLFSSMCPYDTPSKSRTPYHLTVNSSYKFTNYNLISTNHLLPLACACARLEFRSCFGETIHTFQSYVSWDMLRNVKGEMKLGPSSILRVVSSPIHANKPSSDSLVHNTFAPKPK